jgi:hypothetical protein
MSTMTCERCDEWLQDLLDGGEPDALQADHIASCPACAELYESALSLRKRLSLLAPPSPPRDLSGRVVSAVLFDRKRRTRRQQVARVAALAASVLLVLSITDSFPTSRKLPSKSEEASVVNDTPISSPRQMAKDAGSAVADVTTRKVSEALGSTSWLWQAAPMGSLPSMDDASVSLEQSARPLSEAGKGVSAGLEPVTDSARRAFALFVRDLTPGNLMGKPGS